MEWHDNGVGAYTAVTPQQEEALKWIEGLSYSSVTVTGHSKGGNKAQFVAIMSDKVDRCVSFDGQGFSMEFMAQNRDRILENSSKITCIADKYDFVNCLMFPIPVPAGQRIYIEADSIHKLSEFAHNHCPNTMITADGRLNGKTGPSLITKLVNSLTQYICSNMKEPDRSYVIDGLLANFEGGFADESGDQIQGAIKGILKGLSPAFINTLPPDLASSLKGNIFEDAASVINYVTDDLIPYMNESSRFSFSLYLDDYSNWENHVDSYSCISSINNNLDKLEGFIDKTFADSNDLQKLNSATYLSDLAMAELDKLLGELKKLSAPYIGFCERASSLPETGTQDKRKNTGLVNGVYDNCAGNVTMTDKLDMEGYLIVAGSKEFIDSMIRPVIDRCNELMRNIASGTGDVIRSLLGEINDLFNNAASIVARRIDPIIIDLDGDGIETTGGSKGVYFDLDKNSFAEKTGWVKGDDGLLAVDNHAAFLQPDLHFINRTQLFIIYRIGAYANNVPFYRTVLLI